MSEYDGSIRIKTQIDSKNAAVQLATLENRISKTADKIAGLRSKMDALKDTKIPTQEYKDLEKEISSAESAMSKMLSQDSKLSDVNEKIKSLSQSSANYAEKMKAIANTQIPTQEYSQIAAQIEKAEHEFDKLLAKQEQMQNEGKDNGVAWNRINNQIDEAGNTIRYAKGELQDLVDTGKAFVLGADTNQYKDLATKYESVNRELEKQKAIHSEIAQKQAESVQKTIELKAQMQQLVKEGKAFTLGSDTQEYSGLGRQLEYAEKDLAVLNQRHEILTLKQQKNIAGYKNLANAAKKAFESTGKTLKKINSYLDSFAKRIKTAFSELRKGSKSAGKNFSGITLSLKNILKYGFGIRSLFVLVNKLRAGLTEGFTNLLTYSRSLNESVEELKASATTLKNSFAAAFSPIVEIAIPYVRKLIDYMSQLISIAGQFFSALTGRKTYIKAIKQTTNALKNETKEMNKQLSSLDKLNNLTSEKGGSDTDFGGTMFEEVPIEKDILGAADKLKDVLSRLFEPIKKAWNREGKFVMNAWKKALKEVRALIKDIGRDFLRVWEQPATVDLLSDILHIIGDIGLVVANLARNFRAAWNENEVGFHILEKIRDIIGIIVKHIRNAADATVEWADKLNFYPLLDAIDRFLESIKPVVDAVWGVLEDFYTKVLLPLGKWTLEKGLPDLLQVFIDFNNKVDWESLRANLAEFWEHLEPFAETVGEGLILFIERVSDALADFLNSEEFKDFLQTVEDWMDSVSPEDVADALEKVAKGLVTLKLALLGYSAIKGIYSVLTTVKTFLSFFGVGGGAAGAGAAMEGTASSLGVLAGAISDFAIATGGALGVGELLKNKMWESAEANGIAAQAIEDSKEHYDGFMGSLRLVKDEIGGLVMGMQGLPNTITSSVGAVDALNKAMEATANGTIYTDEQMQKMQSTWGFTAEDMEMLRQSMLDTNPELREIADNFGLVDASAQTLGQIDGSMKLVNDRILETSELSEKMKDFIPVEVTNDAQAFFDAVSNGTIDLDTYRAAMDNTSGDVQQFSADMVEAGTNIGAGLTQGMENVDTDTPATGFFDKLVGSIKSIFGIASPAANMNPLGENIILGVVEGFKDKITEFNTAISQMFTQISAKFTSGLSALKNVWTSAWSALPNTLKGIINQIMSMLSSLMSSISSAFSKISSFGSRVGGKISSAFKGISAPAGIQVPVSPVVAALSDVEIPAYATGQVIPRTMKQHLAVLGDNTR